MMVRLHSDERQDRERHETVWINPFMVKEIRPWLMQVGSAQPNGEHRIQFSAIILLTDGTTYTCVDGFKRTIRKLENIRRGA